MYFGTPYGGGDQSGNFRRAIPTASMCLGAVRLAYAGKWERKQGKDRRHDGCLSLRYSNH